MLADDYEVDCSGRPEKRLLGLVKVSEQKGRVGGGGGWREEGEG